MNDDWRYDSAHDLELAGRERLRSLTREPGLPGVAANLLWRGLMRGYLAVAHRLAVEGRENMPAKPPFVVVANHASHLDAVILGLAVPVKHVGRVFPIASGGTFFEKPVPATFATACMNALPLWRRKCGGHTLDELRRRLVEDECVFILFPEGTRSRNGEIARFKPGLGRLVCGTEVPVVPCYIDGAWRAMPPQRKLPRPTKVRVKIGEPLVFAERENKRSGWEQALGEVEEAVRGMSNVERPTSNIEH